jgi:hypothetical protein
VSLLFVACDLPAVKLTFPGLLVVHMLMMLYQSLDLKLPRPVLATLHRLQGWYDWLDPCATHHLDG